jgi:hypothetical protein
LRTVLIVTMLMFALITPASALAAAEITYVEITILAVDLWTPFEDGTLRVYAYTISRDKVVDPRERVVIVQQYDTNGTLLVSEFYELAAADLVITASLTRGRLHLRDGSLITWIATADGFSEQWDSEEHVGGQRVRTTNHLVAKYARASGTFGGRAFDSGVPHPILGDEVIDGPKDLHPIIYRVRQQIPIIAGQP